jgi:hypothetical protein
MPESLTTALHGLQYTERKIVKWGISDRYSYQLQSYVANGCTTKALKPFVGCLFGAVFEKADARSCRWVPKKLNIADDATREDGNPDLAETSKWVLDPSFLQQSEDLWPAQPYARHNREWQDEPIHRKYESDGSSSAFITRCHMIFILLEID